MSTKRIKGYYEYDSKLTPGRSKRGGIHSNLYANGKLKTHARFIPEDQRASRRVMRGSLMGTGALLWLAGRALYAILRLTLVAVVAIATLAATVIGVGGARANRHARTKRRQRTAIDPVNSAHHVPTDVRRRQSPSPAPQFPVASARANWYPDAMNPELLRFWDGVMWTHHTAPRHPVVRAGWYPDTAHPQQLRFWDGTAWTHHVRPKPSSNMSTYRPHAVPSAPHEQGQHSRVKMSRAEWEAHVRAWMTAGALEAELWRRLSNAEISDPDEATLSAQQRMEQLSHEEGLRRIELIVQTNPALSNTTRISELIALFGAGAVASAENPPLISMDPEAVPRRSR